MQEAYNREEENETMLPSLRLKGMNMAGSCCKTTNALLCVFSSPNCSIAKYSTTFRLKKGCSIHEHKTGGDLRRK
jgi:hypothetical protein